MATCDLCPNCKKQQLQSGETLCPSCKSKQSSNWAKFVAGATAVGVIAITVAIKLLQGPNRNKG